MNKDIAYGLALAGSIGIGVYILSRQFIEPYTFEVQNSPNPLIKSIMGSDISDHHRLVENIVFDSTTDMYWMIMMDWEAPKNVRLASCPKANFEADPTNSIWTIEPEGIVSGTAPFIGKFNGKWHIYTRIGSDMYVLISDSVNMGYSSPILVLNHGQVGEWDYIRVDEPYVVEKGGIYYMLYMGEDADLYEKVGLATSTSPTGPFIRHPSNPVLSGSDVPGNWDSGLDRAADPYAFQLNPFSNIWYVGVTACISDKTRWNVGFFKTINFVDYEPMPNNPVIIHTGTTTDWDGKSVLRGAAFKVGYDWYVTYTGKSEYGYYQGGISRLVFI